MAGAEDGGKLSIKTETTNDCVRIPFADDGPGIPAEQLDKLSPPFSLPERKKVAPARGLVSVMVL